jgi:hypothetical protein
MAWSVLEIGQFYSLWLAKELLWNMDVKDGGKK